MTSLDLSRVSRTKDGSLVHILGLVDGLVLGLIRPNDQVEWYEHFGLDSKGDSLPLDDKTEWPLFRWNLNGRPLGIGADGSLNLVEDFFQKKVCFYVHKSSPDHMSIASEGSPQFLRLDGYRLGKRSLPSWVKAFRFETIALAPEEGLDGGKDAK